jgi:glycosyltransferase involved in cell wall biosynthesis
VRLALFLNLPMHEVGGEYTARYPHLFDFFLALGASTAQTALVLPLKRGGERNPEYGTVDLPPQVRVIGLPHWSSARVMVRRAHRVIPAALVLGARRLRRFDLVGAVAPSLVGGILIAAARAWRRPAFMLVRGEKQRTVRFMMGARRARPYVAALKVMEAPVRHWIGRGVPAFVAGRELVDRYAAPRGRVYDLYPALSRQFPLAEQPRTQPAGRPRLITVARLSAEKGVDDAIRALAVLGADGVEAELEVVGEGPQRSELEALAGELGVSERIHFAGFVPQGPELVRYLDQADLFVLASRSEGLPHSLVEAMARGLPVVATAIGGIPTFLLAGGGMVVPVGDPEALGRTVGQLLTDKARWSELSGQALELARRMHPEVQLEELTAHLLDAYPGLSRPRRRR